MSLSRTQRECWWCHRPLTSVDGELTVKVIRARTDVLLLDVHMCGDGKTAEARAGIQAGIDPLDLKAFEALLARFKAQEEGQDEAILLG